MRGTCLVALMLCAAPGLCEEVVPAPAPARLADLAWLAGSWCGRGERGTQEEHWVAPRGGVMLGLHRDAGDAGGVFFEFLRIEQRDDGVVYYAAPAGRTATPFRLVEASGTRAVFANPQHDFPQRIIYESTGDELIAKIEGDVDGETRSSGWRWRKDACGFLDRAVAAD